MASTRRLRLTAIGVAAFFLLPLVARGAGGLDATFGSRGLVTTELGRDSIAWSVLVQPDGKPVIGGFSSTIGPGGELGHSLMVARYTQAGQLDPSFDGDGVAVTTFSSRPTPYDIASDVALQPDGKIVAAGTAVIGNSERFALARYNADGTLDPSFGSGGTVITDFGDQGTTTNDRVHSMALAGDGKIVVAGSTHPGPTLSKNDFALARYNANGSLDASFGHGGKVVTDLGADDVANGLALLVDGKIVAAGVKGEIVAPEPHIAVVRYKADGTLDSTFGRAGELVLGTGVITSVLAQPDAKLLLAGGHQRTELIPSDGFLMRLTSGGAVDKSYGAGGTLEQNAFSINALAFDSRGGTVAVGIANGFMVSTFTKSGAFVREFDPDFGLNGAALAVSVAHDGKIVAAGADTHEGSRYTIALARFLPVECVVPELRAKTLDAARLAIRRANCAAGTIGRKYSRTVRSGRVIAQAPAAGRRLAGGAAVNLTVSRGRKRP
jgi:uncharacterized delta-60 repeat protein